MTMCVHFGCMDIQGTRYTLTMTQYYVPGCSMTSLEVQDSVHDFSGTIRLTPENTEEEQDLKLFYLFYV